MLTAAWVEVDTSAGNFVIQRGHAPMILSLEKKPVTILLANGKQETIQARSGGIMQVDREAIKLLLDE